MDDHLAGSATVFGRSPDRDQPARPERVPRVAGHFVDRRARLVQVVDQKPALIDRLFDDERRQTRLVRDRGADPAALDASHRVRDLRDLAFTGRASHHELEWGVAVGRHPQQDGLTGFAKYREPERSVRHRLRLRRRLTACGDHERHTAGDSAKPVTAD